MVILVHSPHPHSGMGSALAYGLISYLCSPCIGLFLMVSGALLLPVKLPAKEFVSRRLSRILWPLLLWTILYAGFAVLSGKYDYTQVFDSLLRSPITTVVGFMQGWYLYLLIGIYLFLPIFSAWICRSSKRGIQYFLCLWAIVMMAPYIEAVFGCFNENTLAPFSGYFGYVVLGYYLHNYPIRIVAIRQWFVMLAILVVVSALLPACIYFADIPNYKIYDNIIYNYLSISTVVMCCIIYIFVQNYNKMPSWTSKMVRSFSQLSFGVYLINGAILWYLFRPYFIENPMADMNLEVMVTFIGSTILSYVIIWIVNRLPFRKYIIG